MKLLDLKLNNFGIYAGEHHINLCTNDPSKNIVLIGGINGRGKTTILEAILLALYGKRSISFNESNMSYTAYLKKFVNKSNINAQTSIELSFSLMSDQLEKDSDIIVKIKRSWEDKKGNIVDQLEVYTKDILDEHLSNNWDTYIEEIFPSSIASLFFFDGEKISRLAEEETNTEIKKSFTTLLGINIIDRTISDLKRLYIKQQNQSEHIINNEEIQNLKSELQRVRDELNRKRQEVASYNKDLAWLKKDLENKENELLTNGGNIQFSRSRLLENQKELVESITAERQKLIGLASGSFPLLMLKPSLQQIYDTTIEDQDTTGAKHAIKFIQRLQDNFTKELDKIDVNDKKEKILEIFENEINYAKAKNKGEQTYNLSPLGIGQLDNLLKKDSNELISQLKNKTTYIKDLEKQLEQIENHLLVDIDEVTNNKTLAEIKKISNEIYDKERAKIKLEENVNQLDHQEKISTGQLHKISQKIVNEKIKEEDLSRILRYSNMSIDVLEAFKQRIIHKKINHLALNITECFRIITHKNSLISKIEIDPETLDIHLFDFNNQLLLKSQLSAGEKQMLAISIIWGLTKSSGQNLPVIIDTPLSRLDSSHRTNFLTQYLPEASDQVMILSTDEEISGKYLEMLEKNICRTYLLNYNEDRKATYVEEGYFPGEVS